MDEKRYLISDAAKVVQAEPHVLRYWEEELELPIQRTELGHRYYTEEDIQTFQNIKELKERGFQLKPSRYCCRSLRNEKQILLLRSSIWSRNWQSRRRRKRSPREISQSSR